MSTYAENILARMRDEFIARLPERLAALDAQLLAVTDGERDVIETLHRAAHSLVGAAGVHRLMNVSEAARMVEQLVAALPVGKRVPEERLLALRAAMSRLAEAAARPGANRLPPPVSRKASTRIMVVEDDADQALWLRSVLEPAAYQVELFTELAAFRAACQDGEAPAAVIMDMVFPQGDDAGARAIADLKANGLEQTPVIFLSVRRDIESRLAAYRAGATCYLSKPVDSESLLRVMAETVTQSPAQPYRVLLVDDDREQLEAHAQMLRQAGMTVLETDNPLQVPEMLEAFAAEALVLDMYMPQCSGPELAAALRDDKRHAETPIVYLSAETDISRQLLALGRGGDHFLTKPVEPRHLVAVVSLHAQRFRRARELNASMRATLYEKERHQQAVDAHAIVSVTDTAGNITYVNDKFCEISGYSRDELLGNNHRILKSGVHTAAFYDDMWRTINRGDIWKGEVCNRGKNGQLYWVESSMVPFLDAKGLPYQYISIRTDITELKQNEERLRRGQAYANIGTWDWNIQTGALFWSERIAPLFGYPAGELETTYANFVSAIHPEDRQAVLDAVNACVERDVPYEIEHRVVWPDGTVRWLSERGAVSRNAYGKAEQMLGVVQDIHVRKQIEMALKESQAKLSGLFDLSPLGIALAGMDGRYLEFNEAFRAICGYPAEELKTLDYWALTPIEYEKEEARQLESLRTTGRYGPYEKTYRQKNGRLVPIRLNGILVQDQAGVSKIWSIAEDISDTKLAEQALINARDEAERANQAKSEFLSSMSHELRTPMNAILGFGQLMEYDTGLSEEQKDNVREILKAGQHLLELINEVLDLAKVESGHIALSLEPVDLACLLEECLKLVGSLADKRAIQVSHGEFQGAAVRADRIRLKQAVLNLLSNAIKYNRDKGSVHIDVHPEGTDRLHILVTDTGLGIPAERVGELFQPFNRLDAEGTEIEGTGIGLTITRRIVEMMGGTVDVQSKVGVGSTFWIELPIDTLPEQEHERALADGTTAAQGLQTAQHTLLYIEDNPSNLKLVAQILGRRQHIHLLTAHTPELGLELALARRPELILLDINMPGMDGYQVLAVFKAETSLKTIPIVAITANAMPRDIERGRAAGFTEYLTKPIDVEKLLKTVDACLLPSVGTTDTNENQGT